MFVSAVAPPGNVAKHAGGTPMTDSGAHNAALGERLAQMPSGVCCTEKRLLLYANDALRDMLDIRREVLPSTALSRWLAQGVLEGFHETAGAGGEPGSQGRMIFRHPQGTSYLLYWWADVSKKHGPVRYFTTYEIPLDDLNRAGPPFLAGAGQRAGVHS